MSRFNKMHSNTASPMPHIGGILKEVMKLRMITVTELARKMDLATSGINEYCKLPSMHAAIMWKLGEILEYDFFARLSNAFPLQQPSQKELELQQRITDLKKENEIYQKILSGKLGQ
jgi:plasmid maintenance system antidote protein VapI